jgi:hypothetical protein
MQKTIPKPRIIQATMYIAASDTYQYYLTVIYRRGTDCLVQRLGALLPHTENSCK